MPTSNPYSGGRSNVSSMDFYRRVPKDLTEATALGAFMSICALIIMALLFFAESFAFLKTTVSTGIVVDMNKEPHLALNFNLTFFDLECDYLSVDLWDVLGTNRQNVTKNVVKWTVDSHGNRGTFAGRNREMQEVVDEEHEETLEELHADGVYATDLNIGNYKKYMENHKLVFVDFYASWCIWCQRLHPTWEKLAQKAYDDKLKVKVVKVDCVKEQQLCREMNVRAFPTLRWYEEFKPILDYRMDRTVNALVEFSKRKIELYEKKHSNPKVHERMTKVRQPDHNGCEVSGTLMVNRVPGNFHIEAKSKSHNINAAMANLTHRVNHLSFGTPISKMERNFKRILKQVPENLRKFNILDGKTYPIELNHQAHHHYIKVVSTHFDSDNSIPPMYQFLEQSQVVHYQDFNVPEARFSYDMSPMSVTVKKEGRRWYDYLTSICAIIGGTFTTLGLIDAALYKVLKPKKM